MLSWTAIFTCLVVLDARSFCVQARQRSANFSSEERPRSLLDIDPERPRNTLMHLDLELKSDKDLVWKTPEVPLDVVNYPIAPEGLQLEQVHIYVRHGERTPIRVLLADPPASIPQHWKMCHSATRFQETVSDELDVDAALSSPRRRIIEHRDGSAGADECLLGELTDKGRESTLKYGLALRSLYVDRLRFIPDALQTTDTVYFRSTNIPRTIESLRHLIHGLYPMQKCSADSVPSLLIRNMQDENLLPNTGCKRLRDLFRKFSQAAATALNPKLESLDAKLSKYIGGNPVRLDGSPSASGILDTIRASVANNISVPLEFRDPAIINLIESAVVTEWFSDKSRELRRLGVGRLFEDLTNKLQLKVTEGFAHPLKLLVHATHDSAIAAICASLDVSDEKWPAFTSSITFELFSSPVNDPDNSYRQNLISPSKPAEHYVRMRYQNKNMFLPMCADEGNHLSGHPEFCTFGTFYDRLRELVPADYDAECASSTSQKEI